MNMKITRQNYEIYFIDFYDGALSPEEKSQLMEFLTEHPDLKAEFEAYSHEPVDHTIENYALKNKLFRSVNDKTISSKNVEEFCIACLENDLSDKGREKLSQYLSANPNAQKILNTFRNTILQPEIHPYPHKSKLKKHVSRSLSYSTLKPYLAAAAIVILLVLLYPLIQTPNPETLSEQPEQPDEQPETMTKRPAKTIQSIDNEPAFAIHNNLNRKTILPEEAQYNQVMDEPPLRDEQWLQLEQLVADPIPNQWEQKVTPEQHNPTSNMLTAQEKPDELSIESIKRLFSANTDEPKLSLWKVADAGLKGLGALSESNYSLTPDRNDNGEVESITFSTENYSIKAPVKSSNKDVTK